MTPLEYAAQICYSSRQVLQFSYDMAVKYKDMPGVYCECGVAAGAQVIAMAHGAPNKTIYAFDSFQGLPLPSNRDNQMPGIRFLRDWEQKALPDPGKQALVSSGATVVSLDSFLQHLETCKIENVCAVDGWFEETVQHFDEPISILRLDGDLYNSTYVCLKYLYPKVIKGGLIIIDDWGLPGCRAAVEDYIMSHSLEFNIQMDFITDKNSSVAYWTK